MPKFKITATRTTICELEVEAKTEDEARDSMVDLIADDLERYVVNQEWDFDFNQIEENQ